MKLLRFEFSAITPVRVSHEISKIDNGYVDGDFMHFVRGGAEHRHHFYTFTNGEVLGEIIRFLKSRSVKFDIVEEEAAPPYVRRALKFYRQGGGVIKNH